MPTRRREMNWTWSQAAGNTLYQDGRSAHSRSEQKMHEPIDITTIIFAVLAVFVVWKLRSVLGTRTGHEAARPPLRPPDRGGGAPVAAWRQCNSVARRART